MSNTPASSGTGQSLLNYNLSTSTRHAATLTPQAADLTPFNTLGLRSRAAHYVRIDDPAQLPALSDLAERHGRLLLLGGGSNMVLPAEVDGLVAHMALRGVRLI